MKKHQGVLLLVFMFLTTISGGEGEGVEEGHCIANKVLQFLTKHVENIRNCLIKISFLYTGNIVIVLASLILGIKSCSINFVVY